MNGYVIGSYNVRVMTSMFKGGKVKPEARRRAEQVAEVIRRLDADVLGIVEAATAAECAYFIDEFLPGSGYKLAHGESRGYENLVVLYREPLKVVSIDADIDFYGWWVADIDNDGIEERFAWDKKPLEVVFEFPGGARARLILVHGPTKGIVQVVDFYRWQMLSAAKRVRAVAEAVRLRTRIDELLMSETPMPLVVLGDMNDDPALDQYELALGRGYVDTVTGSIFNPDLVLHNALWWRTADPALQKDLWTLEYVDPIVHEAFNQMHRTWIDHILVTRAMRHGEGHISLVPESGAIDVKDDLSREASDHYAVYCRVTADNSAAGASPVA
jgi:endonuclease/exonuclease/phosphatase family metal-dependent hydrolase